MKHAAAGAAALVLAACGAASPATGPDMDVILAERPAATLSAYGLFEDAGARTPALGVTEYDLVNPLFSDHAEKHRHVFVPAGKSATYDSDEVFAFPVGSVLIKTFAFAPDMRSPRDGERYIETRLLIRKADGWAAYPYVWNAEGTEARYAPVGSDHAITTISPAGEPLTFTYATPNQNQCKTCHQSGDAIVPIGPKARNLNHDGPQGENQIEHWVAAGLLAGAPDAPPAAPSIANQSLPLPARARAYLDINCAHCHKGDGSASNSGLWLETSEDSRARVGISKYPTAAGRGAGDRTHVIVPGHPDRSIMTYRMASDEAGTAMPELGRAIVDDEGTALIADWIAAMDSE